MKYFFFRIAQFLSRSTPRDVAYWIGDKISWFHYRFNYRSRRAVLANLTRIHQASGRPRTEQELQREAREVFRNFAKYLVDFFSLFHLTDAQRSALVDLAELPEIFQKCLDRGKGLLAVTAHIGNWELAGAMMCMCGFKINAVALVQLDPKLNELFQGQRLARGMQIIPMGHAARPCMKALRRNEVVAILGDRDFTGGGTSVSLFGKITRLPFGPMRLAIQTGAALLPVILVRTSNDTFQFVYADPIFPDGLTLETLTQRVAQELESFIRKYPTQWFVFHNFWDVGYDSMTTKALYTTESASRPAEPETV